MDTEINIHRQTGDDPVEMATGQACRQWFRVLDAWQGDKGRLIALTEHLVRQYRLPWFWAQAIAIRYLRRH